MSKSAATKRLPALILAVAIGLGLAACQAPRNYASGTSVSDAYPDGVALGDDHAGIGFHGHSYGCGDWMRERCLLPE